MKAIIKKVIDATFKTNRRRYPSFLTDTPKPTRVSGLLPRFPPNNDTVYEGVSIPDKM